MNTPKPCDSCENLYYSCMSKDNPADEAECKLEKPMGMKDCKLYKKYKMHEVVERKINHETK